MDNGTGGQEVVPLLAPQVSGMMPMDPRTLKTRIFSAEKKVFRSKVITFFGEEIEIRQNSIGQFLANVDNLVASEGKLGVTVLINYGFVPGTDLHVFEDTDAESLMSLPYGDDFQRVMTAFNEITGSVKAETKNSKPDQTDSK
jgi:hypothetical protein